MSSLLRLSKRNSFCKLKINHRYAWFSVNNRWGEGVVRSLHNVPEAPQFRIRKEESLNNNKPIYAKISKIK